LGGLNWQREKVLKHWRQVYNMRKQLTKVLSSPVQQQIQSVFCKFFQERWRVWKERVHAFKYFCPNHYFWLTVDTYYDVIEAIYCKHERDWFFVNFVPFFRRSWDFLHLGTIKYNHVQSKNHSHVKNEWYCQNRGIANCNDTHSLKTWTVMNGLDGMRMNNIYSTWMRTVC